jgi:hypothetical protein
MNAFHQACKVEHESRRILEPLIELVAHDGRWVWNGKGRLAKELQASIGDITLNTDAETVWAIELKAERDSSRNFFLEAWSNRSTFNPGWMWKSNADILLYHFLISDEIYCIDFVKLKRWFHDCPHRERPPWTQWPQALQGRYQQRNDTWGILVPIARVEESVGLVLLHPVSGRETEHRQPRPAAQPMVQKTLPSVSERPRKPGPELFREYEDMFRGAG